MADFISLLKKTINSSATGEIKAGLDRGHEVNSLCKRMNN